MLYRDRFWYKTYVGVGEVHLYMHVVHSLGIQRNHAVDSSLAEPCWEDVFDRQSRGAVEVAPVQPSTMPV